MDRRDAQLPVASLPRRRRRTIVAGVLAAVTAVALVGGTVLARPAFLEGRLGGTGPEADLVGQVRRAPVGAASLSVLVVDPATGETRATETPDDAGAYRVESIPEGEYLVVVRWDQLTLGATAVRVPAGADEVAVPPIEVGADAVVLTEPAVPGGTHLPDVPNPVHLADRIQTAAPLAGRSDVRVRYKIANPPQADPAGPATFGVTLSLEGPAVDRGDVVAVTYYLHPGFSPNVVARFPESGFVLTFETWGVFPLSARVYLADGTFTEQVITFTPNELDGTEGV